MHWHSDMWFIPTVALEINLLFEFHQKNLREFKTSKAATVAKKEERTNLCN